MHNVKRSYVNRVITTRLELFWLLLSEVTSIVNNTSDKIKKVIS